MGRGSRLRNTLIATIATLVAVIVMSLIARGIVLNGFARIEQQSARANVDRANSALQARIGVLARVARDWAPWDDTYEFANDGNQEFIDGNLGAETLANLGIDYMVFLRTDRTLVYAVGVDGATGESIEVSPELIEAATSTDSLFDLPELDSSVAGLVEGPDGPMMAASAPITDSNLEQPARGTLIIMAALDDAEIAKLAEQTKLDLVLVPLAEADEWVKRYEALEPSDSPDSAPILDLDDETMVGLLPVEDANGRPMGRISVRMKRDVWLQGLTVARWLAIAIGLFGALGFVAVMSVIDRRVLTTTRGALEHAVAERTRELVTSEARFRDLVDHMAQGLLALDADGAIEFANREAERLFGVGADALVGRKAGELFIEDDLERHLVGADARVASVDATITRYGAPIPVQIVATGSGEGASGQWLVRDVTMQRRYEQQLVHLASHDHLTGLMNRRRFEEELEREVARAVRTGHGGGILWLDLDDFKEVNDSLGHRAGDELLVGVASFLLSSTRASGVVARIGGDEFAILVPEATVSEMQATAERLVTDISQQRFDISGHRLAVTASVGAVVYPDHGASVEELLSRADIAMYAAKERGTGGHVLWESNAFGDEPSRTRLEWSERIRHAVENDTVIVYAQPIAESATGVVASHELLMRLPGDLPGDLIMPGDFLPAAERLGLIRDLDRWMVLNAIDLVAAQPHLGIVHVNLSGRAFADPGLLTVIEEAFERTGANPTQIGFEITETAAIADIQCARELIGGLRRLGCGLSLDDFGSGFSSFYYLRNLPIDCLKIDGAFVTQLKTSAEDRHLVRAIVELAKALGLNTVAEYVEDEETLAIIAEMGVTFAQGYHVGRPAPLQSILDARKGTPA